MLKQYKKIPKTIADEKFEQLFDLCKNPRDAFLLTLLFETGENEARNKSRNSNIIQVITRLMELYSVYVASVRQHEASGYIFVNLRTLAPLRYSAVRKLFLTLSKKSGFKITPHMLRHTHATNLINSGWDPALVQRRLGHASIQTTLDIYSHVDQKALKSAFKDYQNRIGDKL